MLEKDELVAQVRNIRTVVEDNELSPCKKSLQGF